jgi:hypothetical protein
MAAKRRERDFIVSPFDLALDEDDEEQPNDGESMDPDKPDQEQ